MIFNSLVFLKFIAVFSVLYFILKGRPRLWLMFIASYFFYGWWDWRFLSLIVISTIVDFLVAQKMHTSDDQKERKRLLWVSMLVNLGFLAFFKYYNFFASSFEEMANGMGLHPRDFTLNIILPMGISFYTFQTMSYTIDVYRKDLEPEKDWLKFATFVSFFPQLVAGPIVRASDFLPQFQKSHDFDWNRLITGVGRVIWGFFKKVAIADSIAVIVDQVWANPEMHSSSYVLIGLILYSFQIYLDFSGYSDIAIGLARIFGFDFPENFKTPYFSKGFSEFWKRWHISLSSWLRDYLYIPLGGNRGGQFGTYRNLMITMLLGGLWHGASWNFVVWGFLHGLYLILERFVGQPIGRLMKGKLHVPKWAWAGVSILTVYILTNVAWVFFRSSDFHTAMVIFQRIGSFDNFTFSSVPNKFLIIKGFFLIAILLFIEITNFKVHYNSLALRYPVFGAVGYSVLLLLIALFGTFGASAFIYFQF